MKFLQKATAEGWRSETGIAVYSQEYLREREVIRSACKKVHSGRFQQDQRTQNPGKRAWLRREVATPRGGFTKARQATWDREDRRQWMGKQHACPEDLESERGCRDP